MHGTSTGRFVIPVTVDDLAANGLLEAGPEVCWERSVETLTARKTDVAGLAVASDERIEAFLIYTEDGEILSLRSFVDDSGARLKLLLSRPGWESVRLPKVHPAEDLPGGPRDARLPVRRQAPTLRSQGAG